MGLRVRERFLYEYDFTDGWHHEVRLEQILPLDSRRRYPECIGGRRTAPPEDCGGPWAFLKLRQHYSAFHIAQRLVELLEPGTSDPDDDQQIAEPYDHYEGLVHLFRWLSLDRLDRRSINRRLARLRMSMSGVAA